MTWADYVQWLVAEHGSLAAVAQKAAGTSRDAASVERALRRLRTKKAGDGGDWGPRLLRTFGLPKGTADRLEWMGVYHSRFTDLPVDLCLDQLRAWSRPPISESPARAWLQLGFATCALRAGDLDEAEAQLAAVAQPSRRAELELALVRAFIASKRGQKPELAKLEPLVREVDDPCFTARWLDQRAYGAAPAEARALYERIAERPPFAACKRHGGLAYVAWREGADAAAVRHAEAAIRAAGDGGYTRMRITYLGLLANITGDAAVRERAVSAAQHLGDGELVSRLTRARGSAEAESPRRRPRGAAARPESASRGPRTSSTRRRP